MLTALKSAAFSLLPPKQRFRHIHRKNQWGSAESVSGKGSELAVTEKLRDALAVLFTEYGIKSIVDVPCGDFNWMRFVVGDLDYTGIDIVPEIVAEVQERYGSTTRRFQVGDLIKGPIPKGDLIINRDCFIHLSFAYTMKALTTVKRSGSTYFLASTYPAVQRNEDIVTGRFRFINLARAPYNLPEPILKIKEDEPGKEMWLWKVADL